MFRNKQKNFKIINFLKELRRRNEISFIEIDSLIDRKHKDHRDYYFLASLFSQNLIGFTGKIDLFQGTNMESAGPLMEAAYFFQLCHLSIPNGSDVTVNPRYRSFTAPRGLSVEDSVFTSGVNLVAYLEDRKAKRWSLLWQFIVILSTASATAFFTAWFPHLIS